MGLARCFVIKSAKLSADCTLRIINLPAKTLSQTICWSISTFILACKMGFLEIETAVVMLDAIEGTESMTTPNSVSNASIQVTSHDLFANALYSASTDELETVLCLLDFHNTNESPMYTRYLVVNRLVSVQPSQSESEKALMAQPDPTANVNPVPGEFLTYLITRCAATMSLLVGFCIWWLSIFTACVMSDRVIVK